MKAVKWIVIILVVVIAAFFVVKNALIKKGAIDFVEKNTDFTLALDSINVGLFKSEIEINEFKLLNPPDFPEADALEIERVYVRYDLPSLLSDQVHIKQVDISVPLLVIIEKADGETNLDRLSGKKEKAEPAQPKEEKPAEQEKEKKPGKSMKIDLLNIKLGRAEIHRYSEGSDEPEIDVYELNMDETFHDITEPEDLAGQIMGKIFKQEMMKGIDKHREELEEMGVDPDQVKKLGESLQLEKMGGQLKGLFGK
jgi:uncharacterized protein involved in outer membrane biogenesis